ncbi:MAG TPA: sigma-54 dependent transcriptional regulator [Vicinamibacterales bacterium]|jgi:DNA-binding NtrC family response regulator|nr:sigma-54 dependent transcriptional regulator [Vicinamibacterales bacterium]
MAVDRPRITVVDDDLVTCELLCEVFTQEGFDAQYAQSGESAIEKIAAKRPDVIVSDIRMKSGLDGLALLDRVRREHPTTPVVLITAFGSIDTAIRAVKEGAFDYISKPFDISVLVSTVRRALAIQAAPAPERTEDEDEPAPDVARQMVGRSPAMLDVYKMVARVADANAAILITGESGTGKELVARAIHGNGPRADEPFVGVNCGALTETLLESELFGHVRGSFTGAIANRQGIFEQAGEGTVFLDEIGETSPSLQVKLLRVLQERELVPVGGSTAVAVRARVIAASNTDLGRLVDAGEFRRDLLYRLNVINIPLPPLRERRDDIPLLVTHFLRKYTPAGDAASVTDGAMRLLSAWSWPGNVRELENTIERAVTLRRRGTITEEDLPESIRQGGTESARADPEAFFEGLPTLDEVERRYLLHVLKAAGGNRKQAAEILGINRRTLYRMAERYKLDL